MKMMTKAVSTDADAVFLDLEDAVSSDEKITARQTAITAINELDWAGAGKTISLRVNGLDTIWTTGDIVDVVAAAGVKLDTVILPKVGGADDLYALDVMISQITASHGHSPIGIEGLIDLHAQAVRASALGRTRW